MNISDLVARLTELQIEQSKILEQLATLSKDTETESEGKHEKTKEEDTGLQVGDHIKLLTKGVNFRKGDKAIITKVTESTVYFTVLRNKHSTFKQHRNVQKIP